MTTFLRCPENPNEFIVVELQGSLTSNEFSSFAGLPLSKFTTTAEGGVKMVIGSHLMEGKIEKLKKPLLVCLSESKIPKIGDQMDISESKSEGLNVSAIIRNKYVFKQRPQPIVTASLIKQPK